MAWSTFYQTTEFQTGPLLKAFADDKIKLLSIMIYFFKSIENIVGKGENAAHSGLLKVGIVW